MWKSIGKKFKSIQGAGASIVMKAIKQGGDNYLKNNKFIEDRAKERARFLIENDMIEYEKIKSFRFIDERIPELSNMMIKECGCPAGKFVRQDVITHNLWI